MNSCAMNCDVFWFFLWCWRHYRFFTRCTSWIICIIQILRFISHDGKAKGDGASREFSVRVFSICKCHNLFMESRLWRNWWLERKKFRRRCRSARHEIPHVEGFRWANHLEAIWILVHVLCDPWKSCVNWTIPMSQSVCMFVLQEMNLPRHVTLPGEERRGNVARHKGLTSPPSTRIPFDNCCSPIWYVILFGWSREKKKRGALFRLFRHIDSGAERAPPSCSTRKDPEERRTT